MPSGVLMMRKKPAMESGYGKNVRHILHGSGSLATQITGFFNKGIY